jgi:uncharacterized repeat protein (TIGR01451 family)
MRAGQDFYAFRRTANERYPDPRGNLTGLRAPVFFSLVPEVGDYLRDTNLDAVTNYLDILTDYYDGEYLWCLTRLGIQKEEGESSFHGPELAWSVFLTKAYVEEKQQSELLDYLDRAWGVGDLYHLQKLVAVIETTNTPDLRASTKSCSVPTPRSGDRVTYTIAIRNNGAPITDTVRVEDVLPPEMNYVPGSLRSTMGNPDDSAAPTLRWSGIISDTPSVLLTYAAIVSLPDGSTEAKLIDNTATIVAEPVGALTLKATMIVNGKLVYLPAISRKYNDG